MNVSILLLFLSLNWCIGYNEVEEYFPESSKTVGDLIRTKRTPVCPFDEIYTECYDCKKDVCSDRFGYCKYKSKCRPGCKCPPYQLRNYIGKCVPEKHCFVAGNCSALESITVEFNCTLDDKKIPCIRPMPTRTEVTTKCKAPYHGSMELKQRIVCEHGNWLGPIPRCFPATCSYNEDYLGCDPCEKTCLNPNLLCKGECRAGCYCKPGLVRNHNFKCIRPLDCPTRHKCKGANEKFAFHTKNICEASCADPYAPCVSTVQTGCFCKPNTLRAPNGTCVPAGECPSDTKCVRSNTQYLVCGNCDLPCDDPNKLCDVYCVSGCFCKVGYLLNSLNECVPRESCGRCQRLDSTSVNFVCSKNGSDVPCYKEMASGTTAKVTCKLSHHSIINIDTTLTCVNGKWDKPIPECLEGCIGVNEVYKTCETCEKSCEYPFAKNCYVCREGCFCGDGYVRNPSGVCVDTLDCPRNLTCSGINEAYKYNTPYTCDVKCDTPYPICYPEPATGCFCQSDYVRDVNGDCISVSMCPINTACLGSYEVFKFCERSDVWCNNAVKSAVNHCASGCMCKHGYIRDSNDVCVHSSYCTPIARLYAVGPARPVIPRGPYDYNTQTNFNNPRVQDLLNK